MLVNKKLDRFKQWAGERMGGEAKTTTSDNFKALEQEMNVRSDGTNKLHSSMNTYIKWLSKRTDGEDKEKFTPIGYLGSTMISHGDDFDPESIYGGCLTSMGRAQERIARTQETYLVDASGSWLEGVERNVAQMKEYNAARKKLEQRRLAYDASLAKMQKAKKEDFRVEEELRSQKIKYEEANDDVFRRMEDVKEAERDNVEDLTTFLEAELAYHDKCREILLQLKREWPANIGSPGDSRRPPSSRQRSNTAHSYSERFNPVEEEPEPEPKLTIPKLPTRGASPSRSYTGADSPKRPSINRAATSMAESPRGRVDESPVGAPRLSRVPTDSSAVYAARNTLRPVRSRSDMYGYGDGDEAEDDGAYGRGRSVSPAPSYGSLASRKASWSAAATDASPGGARKAPPPPPPSRAKKPPPPPPPMKRPI
ncbi:uncharacterized protein K452DRAFT_358059 [Aplosporella prunicola CBS 121167]|uniref:BAR domain-containing protein n=1 Tax=Aplosporella prunicola CBS 121167 TaxID=1176127 RepID=A0A6A6BFT8_9PEZI|nr:uncharacterized protein K452DRAFT_358059 [Aplosporella prunicola CBS 121167]KAF2143030.1 hypothetical protein K452DRAFT_358059 [Aplosporella prunicola CBS 121167]